ncbi:hypothetical protein P5673_003050 [Acropora cervicornis]|uniref:Uncharacterized protein n=1 Tax=Acropora cervicornis TaxID=6130 RepID=A0AAD9R231_ACRCE|nr:hypothetical protein P5673_003050 [Acropora cervicornis]
MEIRSITISFAARKAKEFRKQESDLQKRLGVIDKSISNSCDNQNIEDKLKEFDKLKNEFNRLYEIKGKGAIFRSKARCVEYGEKPTKYFFNMEKKSYNKKVISELKRSDGKTVVNEQEIMTAFKPFMRICTAQILITVTMVLITKSLGIPHLIYSKSMLVTPSEVVSSVTTSLFDFIWCKKPDKIKRQVMY